MYASDGATGENGSREHVTAIDADITMQGCRGGRIHGFAPPRIMSHLHGGKDALPQEAPESAAPQAPPQGDDEWRQPRRYLSRCLPTSMVGNNRSS
uniref:Uncharacterized protein n=2 Tax=Oryza TaxID=4527 RepID=A0A0D3HEB1_9ORYZ